jgi:hypothetical protein
VKDKAWRLRTGIGPHGRLNRQDHERQILICREDDCLGNAHLHVLEELDNAKEIEKHCPRTEEKQNCNTYHRSLGEVKKETGLIIVSYFIGNLNLG